MKKILSLLLCVCLVFSFSALAFAEEPDPESVPEYEIVIDEGFNANGVELLVGGYSNLGARIEPELEEEGIVFTYTSAEPEIATVSEDGTVTGISVGTTTVTISAIGLNKDVTVAVYGLYIDPDCKHLTTREERNVTQEADCTHFESGTIKVICENCGETVSEEGFVTPFYKHGEKRYEHERVEPTCVKEGIDILREYCTLCGQELHDHQAAVQLQKVDHGFVVDENGNMTIPCYETRRENVVDASCTEDGSCDEVVWCTECNCEVSRKSVVIKSEGHQWGEWEETENARTRTCSACGETQSEPKEASERSVLDGIKDMVQRVKAFFSKIVDFFRNVFSR